VIASRRRRLGWRCWKFLLSLVLIAAAATTVATAPILLVVAARHGGPRRRNTALNLLHFSWSRIAWLWQELRRTQHEPRGPWHPCQQCGYPISNRSRARYCSTGCRTLARLHAHAAQGDERARTRLAWLTREDTHDPAWGEVPF